MRLVRSLILIGAIVALAAFAPSASASVARPFHAVKVCKDATCEITSSTYRRIPAGTIINYSPTKDDGVLTAVITVKHGTAIGRCDLRPIFAVPSSPGSCAFASGTGSLNGLHLNVAVNTDGVVDAEGKSTWTWDGTYYFGCHR